MIPFLFATLVLAWGFTWYAIKLQLGPVPMEASIFYRFVLAAMVLWAGLALTGRLKPAPLSQHRWFALMGASLFGLNFVLIYEATQHVASGIVSVLFSAATVFNAVNQWVFLGRRPSRRVLLGAALGIAGIALLFGADFARMEAGGAVAYGVALALGGTFVFSLGNLVSLRAASDGVDLPNAVARGMTWGAVFLALLVLARGRGFAIDLSPAYLLSLLYLAIPGSILAFLAYLSLVARVGADRAAYATVLFPVVALAVSTVLEDYVWTPWAIAGLPLILLGNVVIFARPMRRRAPDPA
ncbi:DMT family transporter [Inquilinus sp. CAU 1745]|uniref:DMT family transporter n=1 Tax=Inquilinus sp. CAU 1745 TaxID=3140369 RepID=UPI00325A805A